MKAETCGCSGKPNCIVITIETCCRRTCEANQIGQGSDKVLPRVASGPIVTERESGEDVTTEEDSLIVERTDSGSVIISKSSDHVKSHSRSRQADLVATKSDSRPLIIGERSKSGELLDAREREVEPREQRMFKLPLLAERHHGPGCAMEISVLEKHDDSCVYKKEYTPGRNDLDDKVGSYDCIGRLVFRTCNSDEVDDVPARIKKTESREHEPHHHPPTPRPSVRSHFSEEPQFHSASQMQKSKSNYSRSPENSGFVVDNKSTSSKMKKSRSNKSAVSHKSNRSAEHEDVRSILEPPATSKQTDEVQRAPNKKVKGKKSRVLCGMVATNTNPDQAMLGSKEVMSADEASDVIRRHYPGDGCKLHPPKNPFIFGSSKLLKEVSTSKKKFPVYTDEANQTDLTIIDSGEQTKMRFSQETITSLTDEPKIEGKRKSNFLGSLFRRSYSAKPDSLYFKKFKK